MLSLLGLVLEIWSPQNQGNSKVTSLFHAELLTVFDIRSSLLLIRIIAQLWTLGFCMDPETQLPICTLVLTGIQMHPYVSDCALQCCPKPQLL